MSYKAKIGSAEYQIDKDYNNWSLDKKSYSISACKDPNIIQITDADGLLHEAVIQHIDSDKKSVILLLNQKEISIDIQDPIDQRMLALGIDIKKLSKAKNIKAPMPGLILKTLVKEGEHVKGGAPLFILEAMKMENVFKAPDDVEIKNILINEGDTVDKNQELIVFT